MVAQGTWRGEFDAIVVTLYISGWLVNAYEAKLDDLENRLISDQLRQVVRRVVNPFWLIREVLRYGQDCEVVSPEVMRDRVKQVLIAQCQQYGISANTLNQALTP